MSGAATTHNAVSLYHELNSAVGEAGMEFRKWSSNDPAVLEAIPESMRETDPHSFDSDQTIKALGVQWSPTTDSFMFKYVKPNMSEKLTKRILLSDLSRVFDPLGFLGALTIRAKLLLQELWKLAVSWDEPISTSVREQWEEYQEDMKSIVQVQIPRLITSAAAIRYELHGFSDASERAYGAVVYLRTIIDNGTVSVHLLTSKTRVAPLKQVTLPRLELMGAVLLAELMVYVCDSLKVECEIFCWCDSTITLRWIASQPRRWKTFVANRVAKIQDLIPAESWKHVPGKENPADLASRGVSAETIINNTFWWNGPSWLSEPTLPIFPFTLEMNSELEERNLPILVHHVQSDTSILERFSSLTRLKRVVAHILRLSFDMKNPHQKRAGPLLPTELQIALLRCVKISQQESFGKEIASLQNSSSINHSSKLRSLHPYLDNDGIIRVSGRLHNSNIPEMRKHQIILSRDSSLTKLIIKHFHYIHFHSGFQLTWATIQAEFWILHGRDKVRHFIRSCVTCRRHKTQVAEQLMGNLPESRVTPARPFLHTGVDYAGPFVLKNPIGRAPKTYKSYMCLFVCMVTKAIHLEAVSSLSTDAFLATFRRFVSRRGLCAHIYSDCGTNFVGAEKEIKTFISARETNHLISDSMTSQGVSWHFNPPSAPHQGGLWEAGVKSAKHHLRRVIGNSVLTFEQFQTVLCQVEAILNSRPLHPMSPDPSDFTALTPGHFLIGEPLTFVPDVDLTEVRPNRLNLFQLQQQRVQHFWKRWSQEYLNTLQQRTKWYWEQENVQLGDLVLVKEESSPGTWKLGRISAVHPGDDGRVRVVTLKTSTTSIQRPVAKLIPLLSIKD
ncbi:unnamed protein product [Orchesella dallaii]|uniref:Integrase catalytic domain-containing protein n=1 Tax=Orchesella dallaii TaxID=48710 RepID=A0ABP1RQV1_9HEXA